MKVSVVVPSYNQAKFLRATLESLLTQEGEPAEVIVFDGGSNDGSVDILREYDGRIWWTSAKDRGQSDAINRGLRRATGEILAYLNSDDVYFPGALQAVRAHFARQPNSLAVYGRAHHLHEDGSYMEDYPTEPWNYARLQETCFLCQPATFWRRGAMEQFGVFDARLHYAMDYEYWLRLGRHFPFAYLADEPALAGSRLHGDTKTLSARVKVHQEILQVVQRHATGPAGVEQWLRHLAHHRTFAVLGQPDGREAQRAFTRHWSSQMLLTAAEFDIPMGESTLAEIDRHLAAMGH